MKSINMVFAVHNHQPIGNFENVIEGAYQDSYKPFLEILKQHPEIKFTQHWTGTLLEWLHARHPEFIGEMKELVHRGQLELLTGAYYEAILAIIPDKDRVGQIKKLTDTIQRLFDYTPRGMWLAERVWEQQLVASLVKAGVEIVIVDDTHFRHAGLDDEQLVGYYMTEDQGAILKVMPIDKTLRYTIPFREVAETKHYLQIMASEHGDRVVIHGDDGEKFGVWPKTHEAVYEKGWLESFGRFLEENRSWIRTLHLSTVADTFQPLGRIYLPTASYSEMMKWVLPPTAFLQLESFEKQLKSAGLFEENGKFVRGGYWRNFLSKYPEANHMQKKMLRVSTRARTLSRRCKVGEEIFDHVWAGQCNDPYWHGVFGGLYLPNLRFPVYHHLLKAERELDRIEGQRGIRVETTDFDCDGAPEILVESDILNLYFKPSTGGSLVELDYKPRALNLLDIISRREEGYHRRLKAAGSSHAPKDDGKEELTVKEEGLEKHLHFDWYRHASLIDHFFGDDTGLQSFSQSKYLEVGDFVNQPYTSAVHKTGDEVAITLTRDGAIWKGGTPHHITVHKKVTYRTGSSSYLVTYEITNHESAPIDIWFGVEFNVGLMAGNAHDRYYDIEGRPLSDKRLGSTGEELRVTTFKLVDEWLGLETCFRLSSEATLWRSPIETVSLSEAGLERLYQSSMITPHWKVRLDQPFRVSVEQSIRPLSRQNHRKPNRRKARRARR